MKQKSTDAITDDALHLAEFRLRAQPPERAPCGVRLAPWLLSLQAALKDPMHPTLASNRPPPAPRSVSDLIEERHRILLDLLGAAAVALEPGLDSGELERRWLDFRRALVTQLDDEDRELIPFFAGSSERNVRVLVHEHRHIRERIADIDAAVAARRVKASELSDLSAILRAHFRSEARMMARYLAEGESG